MVVVYQKVHHLLYEHPFSTLILLNWAMNWQFNRWKWILSFRLNLHSTEIESKSKSDSQILIQIYLLEESQIRCCWLLIKSFHFVIFRILTMSSQYKFCASLFSCSSLSYKSALFWAHINSRYNQLQLFYWMTNKLWINIKHWIAFIYCLV